MILKVLLSAVLLYLAFPNIIFLHGIPVLSWVFAIPLFFALENKDIFNRMKVGLLFGCLANFALVNWMIPYSLPGYFLLVLALASQAVIFAVLYGLLKNRLFLNIFYVAGAWVAAEYLRKLLMLGESWNLAHCQSFDMPLMQIANILGSSAVSFVMMAVNVALYRVCQNYEQVKVRITSFVVAVVLVAVVYSYGFFSLLKVPASDGQVVKMIILQTNHNYRGELAEDRIHAFVDQNIGLTREATAQMKVDLIIWPETAIPSDFTKDVLLYEKLSALARESGANFLFGAVMEDQDGRHNSAVLMNDQGEIEQVYHKRHLIPLTEFIPPSPGWQLFAEIFKVKTPELVAGDKHGGMMKLNLAGSAKNVLFGVAICSEDNIDRVFRDYDRRGAQFIIVLLNNGWFTQKAGFVMHGQHSLVRAVENGVKVVRSANRGLSGVIDEFGALEPGSQISLLESKAIMTEMILPKSGREKKLGYNLQDIFSPLCLGFVIIMQIMIRNKTFTERWL